MKIGKRYDDAPDPDAPINLWVGTEADADHRLQLALSQEDRALVNSVDRDSNEHFIVTDLRTGKRYELKRVSCGLDCRCAIDLVAEVE